MKQFPLLVLILGCLATACNSRSSSENADDEPLLSKSKAKEIIALGRLIPESGVINIGATPGDQIEILKVEIGSKVDKNQLLMVLASHEIREKELSLAEARLVDAKKNVGLKQSAAADQLEIAKASKSKNAAFENERRATLELIRVQKQRVEHAEHQIQELQQLFESDANRQRELVTRDDIAKARLSHAQAKAELDKANAELALAEEKQRVNKAVVDTNVQIAQNQVETAGDTPLAALESAIELAKANLARSSVRAPISGVVISLFSHQGDLVTNRPVLRMANLDKMICIAEVYESQLALIDANSKLRAEITSPALIDPETNQPLTLIGTVFRKSQMVGKATLIDPNPLAPQDRRTAEVFIRLHDESTELSRNYINLQARVRIVLAENSGD